MPALESAPPSDATLFLEQTRIFRAPRARVYEAWTTPDTLMKWFGPAGMHSPLAELDVRPGGAYRVVVQHDPTPENPAGRRTSAVGIYTQVVPNERLQFTWIPDFHPGEDSLVTLTFKDVPHGTQLTIRHERFATESSRDGHNKGWAGSLDKLAALLES